MGLWWNMKVSQKIEKIIDDGATNGFGWFGRASQVSNKENSNYYA